MQYNDLFIYKQEKYYTKFILCRFIIDRKDIETILCVEEGSFFKVYLDIPYENKNNIFTLEQFENFILNENKILNENIVSLQNLKQNILDYGNNIIRHSHIVLDLKKQIDIHEKYLKYKEKNQLVCKNIKKYINDLNKGIKRHNKKLYGFYNQYKDISYEDVVYCDSKILQIKYKIKHNNEDLDEIKKLYLEKKGDINV